MELDWRIITIFVLIIIISAVDVGINVLSVIPYLGGLIETVGESILEVFQIALVGLIVVITGKS